MASKKEDWQKIVRDIRLRQLGTWRDAAHAISQFFPDLTLKQLILKAMESMENDFPEEPEEDNEDSEETLANQKVTYKENGEMIFEGIVSLLSGQAITPELVMSAHNLNPNEWKVVSFTSNAWQSQVKDGNKMTLWQSKITVRPKSEKEITFADVDNYFDNKKLNEPIVELPESELFDDSGCVLEICIPDLHSGLLSWRCETGEDYDLNIAKERFFKAISDIIRRSGVHSFSKVLLVTLGDLLHTDNDSQTTTKGTFQQVDGRLAKIFDCTLDMLIDAVKMLSSLAPVEVIYISGNHDRVLGYTLVKAAKKAFEGNEKITFDTSPNPQKFRLIGNSLVGWTHGDMPKKNMHGWLQDRARKEFGESKYAEIHSGHYHSEQVVCAAGVTIRYMPNLASASYWEHQQGFPNTTKTVICYRWHKEKGLRSIWYNNI